MFLNKIDKYILKNFLMTFLFCILAFTVIAIVIDYTEKVQDFVKHQVPSNEIFQYFYNFIPHIIALLFPIFIFVSVIFFTSRMAYRSEFIAILATGMEFRRMLRPYFIGSGIICLVLLYANHYVIPEGNKQRLAFERSYIGYQGSRQTQNIDVRVSDSEFVSMSSYSLETNNGYSFNYNKIKGTELLEKITANRCTYDTLENSWTLYDVKKRTNNKLKETFVRIPESTIKMNLVPSELYKEHEERQHMTTPELIAYINKEKSKGSEGLNDYEVEKHRRTSGPFSAFILSIMGACIAYRRVRGGSGVHLAAGLIISAAYILFMQFSTTFAIKGNLHPMLAVWIPNMFFSLVALFLYRRASN
jgi:lipopolysaccharide export system permease protein